MPRYELGVLHRKAGRIEAAREQLLRALELYDDAEGRSLSHNTLGTIHLQQREWGPAEERFRAAVAERPGYATPWFNLGSLYGMQAESRRDARGVPDLDLMERCVEALARAVELRGNYHKAQQQLARAGLLLTRIYLARGRAGDAARMRARTEAAAAALGAGGGQILEQLRQLPR